MKSFCSAIAALLLFTITACGNDPGQRALTGGGIGAGVGALGGALLGGSVAGGALIGGLGGAAIGGLTNRHQIDLDR